MPIVIDAPRPAITLVTTADNRLPIIFFGTPAFAVPALRALVAAGWPIALVVTAPDKPVGRSQAPTPSPVKSVAHQLGLAIATPATLKDDMFFEQFESLHPQLCVVVAYGNIIPARYLNLPRLGFVNVHPSLLPHYRGAAPIQQAILDGVEKTGVSIMRIDEQVDHGPVLAQEEWRVPSGFGYPECESELARLGGTLLADTLVAYVAGTVTPSIQDDAAATFTKKFQRIDGKLDWNQPAGALHNQVRALNPSPGTWTTWKGKTFNITATQLLQGFPQTPGTIILQDGQVGVVCGEGALALERVQLEGGKPMDVATFINGHSDFVGSQLSS